MSVLYNKDKWLDIWNKPKYQEIRDKILSNFTGLEFEPIEHRYFLNGKEMECVSNVAHLFQEHFDKEGCAIKTFERHFDNPESKYFGMTVEQILESWKKISEEACTHGTYTHEFSECCFYYMTGQYDKILPEFNDRFTEDGGFKAIYPKEEAVVKFFEDLPQCIVPILAETKVFVEYDKAGYAGTFDILFYYDAELNGKSAENSGLYVMDYKTNRDLYKHFTGKKLLTPFHELDDMPLNTYKLQLSLYENALYKIGLKVVARRILWLQEKDNEGYYEKKDLESYREVIDNELKKIYN